MFVYPFFSFTGEDNITLHMFPNPKKYAERFKKWLFSIGGNLLVLDTDYVYKNARVCQQHFEAKYQARNARLTVDAVPTILLRGSIMLYLPTLH